MSDVTSRNAVPSDAAFVYETWLESYRFRVGDPSRTCKTCSRGGGRDIGGGQAVSEMTKGDYFLLQRKRIDHLLETTAYVLVLHPTETPSVIAAWACIDHVSPAVFHYVYTAEAYRKKGYAKLLVGERNVCTHMTDSRRPDSFAAWKRRAGIRYLPHLLDA